MWAVYADDINKPLGLVVNKGLAVTIAVLELVSPGHYTTKADVFLSTKLFPFIKGLEIMASTGATEFSVVSSAYFANI